MKIERAFINWSIGVPSSNATIDVPGLGSVEIKNFLSDETRKIIENEAILSLRQRMGFVENFQEK